MLSQQKSVCKSFETKTVKTTTLKDSVHLGSLV